MAHCSRAGIKQVRFQNNNFSNKKGNWRFPPRIGVFRPRQSPRFVYATSRPWGLVFLWKKVSTEACWIAVVDHDYDPVIIRPDKGVFDCQWTFTAPKIFEWNLRESQTALKKNLRRYKWLLRCCQWIECAFMSIEFCHLVRMEIMITVKLCYVYFLFQHSAF